MNNREIAIAFWVIIVVTMQIFTKVCSGCTETIYSILQENMSVSGIGSFGLTVQ